MDLTPEFNKLLRKHNAPETRKVFSIEEIDAFLREAYRINAHITSLHAELRDVRQAYLSTAQPRKTHVRHDQQQRYLTDRDREEIDASAKKMLRELNASIRALDDAEQLRRQTEEAKIRKKYVGALGALGSWAAGGGGGARPARSSDHAAAEALARDVGLHRDGVIFFLRQRLQRCGRTQQAMMETRLTREMEKSRSALARAGAAPLPASSDHAALHHHPAAGAAGEGPGGAGTTTRTGRPAARRHGQDDDEAATYDPGRDLTAEQLQMFERGNQDMMKHYESALDKVRTAEKSLIEIAELQNLLVGNLTTQSAHIEQMVADSFDMTDNVGSGNKQLKQASQRPSAAMWTFRATAGLCAFLIIWDLLI